VRAEVGQRKTCIDHQRARGLRHQHLPKSVATARRGTS
jgi:hypothetical protein